MDLNFQKIVIVVAIVFLILILTIIGITLYNHQKSIQFPPVISNCPDYWDVSGNLCINSQNLGKDCGKTLNFNSQKFKGSKGDCNRAKVARNCNITWQGITTNADVCGDTE